MHVLSVEDIDLMIMLVDEKKSLSELVRHEKQMDKLITMGIIRPGGGVLALTDLGYKTANGLLGRCLGSVVDGPLRHPAETTAASAVEATTTGDAADVDASPQASAEADTPADNPPTDAGAEPAAEADSTAAAETA